MGEFLKGPVGSFLRVVAGLVLAALVAVLQAGSVAELGDIEWWQATFAAAVGAALPILIAALNPADTRFGKTE